MKEDDSFGICIFVFVIVVVFMLLGFYIGTKEGESDFKRSLVEQGHAEYYIDEDNNKSWRVK